MIPMMKTIRLMKVLDHQGKGLLTSDDKVMGMMITHLSGMAGTLSSPGSCSNLYSYCSVSVLLCGICLFILWDSGMI